LRAAATRARLAGSIDCAHHTSARSENIAAIRGVLGALPEGLAAVVIYRFVDEMTHAEIATMIGCSRRHVGDLLARFERAMAPARGHL
jgi:DNA-directed RNA polymerase specialized sigma24 family protein